MVQDLGLRLLQRQDNIERSSGLYDSLRLALIASGQKTVPEVYPEYFPPLPTEELSDDSPDDALMDPNATYDYSGVEWQSPSDMSPEELASLEDFLADPTITVYGKDLDDDGGWI